MTDSKSDVAVVKGTWLNLYAASGIAVGTAVTVINKGSQPVYVAVSASAPAVPVGTPKGFPLYVGEHSTPLAIPSAVSGLWCFSQQFNGAVLVQD